MTAPPVPRAALALGLAGLLPFGWGALTLLVPGLAAWAPLPRLAGAAVLSGYGVVILAFMSGVLWGFAARGPADGAATGYALSVLPALWGFFTGGSLPALLAGFVALLALDLWFARRGLAPGWWMRLRLVLTAGVVLCLAVGIALA